MYSITKYFAAGLDYRDDLTLNTASTGLYTTTDFTDEAIRKISAHDTNTPMFLYMAYNAPHSPFEVFSNQRLSNNKTPFHFGIKIVFLTYKSKYFDGWAKAGIWVARLALLRPNFRNLVPNSTCWPQNFRLTLWFFFGPFPG